MVKIEKSSIVDNVALAIVLIFFCVLLYIFNTTSNTNTTNKVKASDNSKTKIIYKEETICRSGKLIWIGATDNYYNYNITSQIIGECE